MSDPLLISVDTWDDELGRFVRTYDRADTTWICGVCVALVEREMTDDEALRHIGQMQAWPEDAA